MFTSQDMSPDVGASIDMYNGRLLRLLAVRERFASDPAPELPPVDGLPSSISHNVGFINDLLADAWRSHWDAVLSELILPKTTIPAGGWDGWPASLPDVDAEAVSTWRKTMPMSPRGTPLLDRPSYQYYLARVASNHELPRRLVVLPLKGLFSYRYSDAIGLISTARFFEMSHPTFGF